MNKTSKEIQFFKLVAFRDDNVFEFEVPVDKNVGTLSDLYKFLEENIDKYKECKWLLLPIM